MGNLISGSIKNEHLYDSHFMMMTRVRMTMMLILMIIRMTMRWWMIMHGQMNSDNNLIVEG